MSQRQVMEGTDRLSDLPDGILHHILSFLDTKSVVQTSVLSTRWRLVWKLVPVLNFCRSSFSTEQGLVRHVDQFLSLRSDCDVFKISTDFRIKDSMDLFERVMKYAASHGVQQLSLLRIMENEYYSIFSEAVACICTCYRSLKALELQRACLDMAALKSLSRLKLLETLSFHSSLFESDMFEDMDEPHDPFAHFPQLKNLQLLHCFSSYDDLKVSGPELLYLEIHKSPIDDIEIYAPKLKSFTYWANIHPRMLSTLASKLSLPSLDHASLNLWEDHDVGLFVFFNNDEKQLLAKQCVDLFHGLRNVKSLSLHLDTTELLNRAYELMKHQPSPFERLKSLCLLHSKGPSSVPYEVISYFLDGSPDVEDKYLMIKKKLQTPKHELLIGSSVVLIDRETYESIASEMQEEPDSEEISEEDSEDRFEADSESFFEEYPEEDFDEDSEELSEEDSEELSDEDSDF